MCCGSDGATGRSKVLSITKSRFDDWYSIRQVNWIIDSTATRNIQLPIFVYSHAKVHNCYCWYFVFFPISSIIFLILINFDLTTGCFSLMRYSIKWYELTKFSYINAAAKRNKNDYAARKRKEKNCYRSNNGRRRQRTCKLIDERRPIKKIANLANERKVIYFYSDCQN